MRMVDISLGQIIFLPWQKMTITDCPMVLFLLLEKNSDQNAG